MTQNPKTNQHSSFLQGAVDGNHGLPLKLKNDLAYIKGYIVGLGRRQENLSQYQPITNFQSLDSDRKAALILYLVDATFSTQFTYFDVDIAILQREIEIAESLPSDQARLELASSLLTDLISHLPEPVASGS